MPVLRTQSLSKSYGKVKALNKLDLTIEPGQIYGILGPNGSGKTTTLGIILNILKQDSGSYEWFDGAFGDKARMKIGAILETPNFYPYMNASQNLDIIRQIKGLPKQDFEGLLKQVNLFHRKKSPFRAYSLGMKQRLAIAATLIGEPEVLIFDEPTNGLDPQGIAEVRDVLQEVAGLGKSVIMASHILDEVEKICSHVAIIKDGSLLATGPIGGILHNNVTVEIAAEDMNSLEAYLTSHPDIIEKHRMKLWYECVLPEGTSASDFGRQLYEHGIHPTRLVLRRRKLEDEFLEITKQA